MFQYLILIPIKLCSKTQFNEHFVTWYYYINKYIYIIDIILYYCKHSRIILYLYSVLVLVLALDLLISELRTQLISNISTSSLSR